MSAFNIYTVAELKQIARERGLSGYSRLRRNELIDLLQGSSINRTVKATDRSELIQELPNNLPDDILYELTQHLSISELKALCSTNQQYAKLCQSPRFSEIINREKAKIEQEKQLQATINELYQGIVNAGFNGVTYNIDNKDHTLTMKYGRNPDKEYRFYTSESMPIDRNAKNMWAASHNKSILHKLFGEQAQSKSRYGYVTIALYPAADETQARKILDVLVRRPDFDRSNVVIN